MTTSPASTGSPSGLVVRLVVVGCLICLGGGCEGDINSQYQSVKQMPSLSAGSRADELTKALELLEGMDQYNPSAAQRQAFLDINRWVVRQPDLDDWTLDPLAEQLPKYLYDVLRNTKPAELRFHDEDVEYLLSHVILRDIARFAAERAPADPLVEPWIAADGTLAEEQRRDLSLAARMFDWTVRSIQLSESRSEVRRPKPAIGPRPQEPGEAKKEASAPPPLRAGPGEMFHASETMLKGHGDMLDRARIFTLLARQHGIDVVVLAHEDGDYVEPKPWICAAVIGTELYLFDMTLGLPIPRTDRAGIATLSYVHDNPESLSGLGTPEEPYRVKAGTVRRVTVQLDAAPQALSRRMHLVERRLAGDRKMVLTAHPFELAARLRMFTGVENVEILRAPYVALRYRKALRNQIKKEKRTENPIVRELLVVKSLPPLFRARLLHFRGRFDAQGEQPGAKSRYLACRPPNAALDQLSTPENRSRLRVVAAGKQAASYWMGLLAYDNTEFTVAREWLAELTLAASPEGPWAHGGRYNLARTWELLGQPDRASEIYEADDSPQSQGNRARAALLRETNQ